MEKINLVKPALEKFGNLSSDELTALNDRIEISSYDKRVIVTDIGMQEDYIYWVAKGLLRKYFYKGKEEVVTDIAKEGDLISSFVSFVKEETSGVIIETIEHSTLHSLSKQNIEWLCDKYPNLQRLYVALITEAFMRSESRHIEKLIYPKKELFRRFINANGELVMRVPQNYLASYLNMKPETFSRFKHLMKQKRNSKVTI